MSCERVRPELPGFQFNTLDDVTRALVEDHLLNCPRCVGEFVAVKRSIETAAHAPRPSDLARARLRRAMAAATSRPAAPSWWERPLALGVAAASASPAKSELAPGPERATVVQKGREEVAHAQPVRRGWLQRWS